MDRCTAVASVIAALLLALATRFREKSWLTARLLFAIDRREKLGRIENKAGWLGETGEIEVPLAATRKLV